MEFELFLYSADTFSDVSEKITELVKQVTQQKLKKWKDSDAIYLSYKFFTITVFNGLNADYINEQYGINTNYCIDIQLFSKTYEQGLVLILKIIGSVISELTGDVLFIGNGSIELIKKSNNGIFVTQSNYYNFQFPYHEIGIPFKVKELE